MFLTLLLLSTIGMVRDTAPADPCASRKSTAPVEAFVALAPVRKRDTLVTASVCVVPRSSVRVGSYHGELYFDSTAARVQRVQKPAGGLRADNATKPGRVNFAGAEPSGFAPGTLLNVVLRIKPGVRPRLQLKILELNAVDGSSLMKELVTTSSSLE